MNIFLRSRASFHQPKNQPGLSPPPVKTASFYLSIPPLWCSAQHFDGEVLLTQFQQEEEKKIIKQLLSKFKING